MFAQEFDNSFKKIFWADSIRIQSPKNQLNYIIELQIIPLWLLVFFK